MQYYLNCYYMNGLTRVRQVAAHEFGHMIFLADIYAGGEWLQTGHQALMYNPYGDGGADGHPQWDDRFGAMFLYGPHYMT